MTVTAFARIVRAMQASLQAAPAVSANVFRARSRVIPRQMVTALVVRPGQAKVDRGVGQGSPGIWLTAVDMECYARGAAGLDSDDAVDALMGAAVARLMADTSLRALVGDIGPEAIDWDFDVDGEQTACATVTFYVRHATAAGVLS